MRRIVLIIVLIFLVGLVIVMPGTDAMTGSLWSLLPAIIAITLALVTRDVLASLIVGVGLGATMLAGGNPAAGFLRLVDTNVRGVLTEPDKVSIIIFSMLLGGMVGVMSRSGGTYGIVRSLEPLVTTPRRAQVVTWLMGMLIFFDDYSNTLIVGNSMRPVTDRHQVSREKLAYLVDSTAAPVVCVAVVSSWIGYQVSELGDALAAVGSDLNPISLFIASIPYAFYPLFALTITFSVAVSRRDWGPMLKAERRALAGELLASNAQPLADYESSALAPLPETPCRWWNAAVPVLLVIVATFGGLYLTGVDALEVTARSTASLSDIINASDFYTTLLWASLIGLTAAIALAVLQGILGLRESLEAMVGGFKSMLMAVVVLVLAWSLGRVCENLEAAEFLGDAVGPHLPPWMLPIAVFLVAGGTSFATGTSWGTIAILTPLAVPLVIQLDGAGPSIVAATVSAILGGSVFGDHCSPISDTTILSSMASGCDHVDHVRTQLPYALLGGGLALVVGYLPAALLGVPPGFLLVAGVVSVAAWVWWVGKPVALR